MQGFLVKLQNLFGGLAGLSRGCTVVRGSWRFFVVCRRSHVHTAHIYGCRFVVRGGWRLFSAVGDDIGNVAVHGGAHPGFVVRGGWRSGFVQRCNGIVFIFEFDRIPHPKSDPCNEGFLPRQERIAQHPRDNQRNKNQHEQKKGVCPSICAPTKPIG